MFALKRVQRYYFSLLNPSYSVENVPIFNSI